MFSARSCSLQVVGVHQKLMFPLFITRCARPIGGGLSSLSRCSMCSGMFRNVLEMSRRVVGVLGVSLPPPFRADQVSGDLSQAHGSQGTDGLCLCVSGIEEWSHKTLSCLRRLRSWSTVPHHQPIPAHVTMGVCDIHLLSGPYKSLSDFSNHTH